MTTPTDGRGKQESGKDTDLYHDGAHHRFPMMYGGGWPAMTEPMLRSALFRGNQ
ncbi:MAG: hypothetical protein J2P17_13940 [Mycobacterium sp.]|nr:hypothetical protein [Mycobacterium sp.]